jgi:hypothetical protein
MTTCEGLVDLEKIGLGLLPQVGGLALSLLISQARWDARLSWQPGQPGTYSTEQWIEFAAIVYGTA